MSYFDTARVLELFGMEMIKGSFCWGRPWILTQWSRKWRKKKTNFQLSKEGVLNIAVSTQHEKLADSFTGHTGLAFHFLVRPEIKGYKTLWGFHRFHPGTEQTSWISVHSSPLSSFLYQNCSVNFPLVFCHDFNVSMKRKGDPQIWTPNPGFPPELKWLLLGWLVCFH